MQIYLNKFTENETLLHKKRHFLAKMVLCMANIFAIVGR